MSNCPIFFMPEQKKKKKMSKWTELTNEKQNIWVAEQQNKWANEQMSKWVTKQISKWTKWKTKTYD